VGEAHKCQGGAPYQPFKVSCPKPRVPGVLTRISSRWYRGWKTKCLPLPVPYIDNMGKFTIHQLGVWRTTPETWFASVVSTINNRLLAVFSKRNSHEYIHKRTRRFIFSVSVFYAYTHSSYVLDRILANLFPKRMRIAERILKSFSCNLGEPFRFVNDQTSFQVLWLSFRSKWTRDKPSMEKDGYSLYPALGGLRKGIFHFDSGNPFLKTINWMVLRRG